jgi:hypothetical protein
MSKKEYERVQWSSAVQLQLFEWSVQPEEDDSVSDSDL